MKFISVDTVNEQVTVLAKNIADAEIFAQENAAFMDEYFEDVEFNSAQDVSEFYKEECTKELSAFVLHIC